MDNETKEFLYRELNEILEHLETRNYNDAMEQLDMLIYKVEYNQI
jgi:hypothetical protein